LHPQLDSCESSDVQERKKAVREAIEFAEGFASGENSGDFYQAYEKAVATGISKKHAEDGGDAVIPSGGAAEAAGEAAGYVARTGARYDEAVPTFAAAAAAAAVAAAVAVGGASGGADTAAAMKIDYEALRELGHAAYPELGDPIDPSEFGPLGPLGPERVPEWLPAVVNGSPRAVPLALDHLSVDSVVVAYRNILMAWARVVEAQDAIAGLRSVLRIGEFDARRLFDLPVGPSEQSICRDGMESLRTHLDREMPEWTVSDVPSQLRAVLEGLIYLYRSHVLRASIAREGAMEPASRPGDGLIVRTVHLQDDLASVLDEEDAGSPDEARADLLCLDLASESVDEEDVGRWVDEALTVIGRRARYEVGASIPRLAVMGQGFSDDLRRRLAVRYVPVLQGRGDARGMIQQIIQGARSTLSDGNYADIVAHFRPARPSAQPAGPPKPASPFDVFPAHADPRVFSDWIDSLRLDLD